MKKLYILFITIGSAFLVSMGSSFSTVFNDGTQISQMEYRPVAPQFSTLPQDDIPWIQANDAKNLDAWKLVLWFCLWFIAVFLWVSLPDKLDKDQQ